MVVVIWRLPGPSVFCVDARYLNNTLYAFVSVRFTPPSLMAIDPSNGTVLHQTAGNFSTTGNSFLV